jgi:gamma-glutamylcyclotransferase (GGCT)/AIG2-like uncharacterized protein YtfP
MMFDEPGTGCQILGELYVLDAEALERVDNVESIGRPSNFRREIHVDGTETRRAHAYFKSRTLA